MQLISRAEAQAKGSTRYFTGKPCKHGHVAERLVSSRTCILCCAEKDRRIRIARPEVRRELMRSWRERNAQHVAEYAERTRLDHYAKSKARRDAEPERFRAIARAYRQANPEKCKERVKRSVEKKAEEYRQRARDWHKNNPGRTNATTRAYRAAKLQRTPAWADLEAITDIYELAAELGLSVDHIVPLQGELVCGLHVQNNLQLITGAENSAKGNKFDPWLFEMGPAVHHSAQIRSADPSVKVCMT